MNFRFYELIFNFVLIPAFLAQMTSQGYKIVCRIIKERSFKFSAISSYGGMPSAHSAFLSSALLSIGFREGWNSSLFGFAFVIFAIMITDIIVVRNKLQRNIELTENLYKKIHSDSEMFFNEKEKLDFKKHSALEIIVGVVWGIIVAIVFNIFVEFRGLR